MERDFIRRADKIKAKYNSASKIWNEGNKASLSLKKKIMKTAPRKNRSRLSNANKG